MSKEKKTVTTKKKTVVSKGTTAKKKTYPVSKVTKVDVVCEDVVSVPTEAVGTHYVGVDYPQEGEIVTSDSYVFRVSTSATDRVQISLDGKEWKPCRESVGFWWYDWSGYGSGAHTLLARIAVGKRLMKSRPRSFTVLI